jgi:fructose-bisphosphate aldolase, class II
MPLVATADIVGRAQQDGLGVAAFNVITLEHAEAIAAGAAHVRRPAILQISENAVKYHHGRLAPLVAATAAVAVESSATLALHLDHVEDVNLLHAAAGTGVTSVMFDASTLAYDDNVAATRAAAEWAHDRGIWLEAELGEIGGKDGAHAPGVRTDPDEARQFVADTLVDGLAVAVGSSHAMVDRSASLDIPLIEKLSRALPVPLVLHGSSGVPDEALGAAIRAGMVKINIGTILNVAFTRAVREHLSDETVVDPRTYLAPARDAVSAEVARILTVLAAARRADVG